MNEITAELRLVHFTSNEEPYRGAGIEITDRASGKRIFTMHITPEQFYSLLSHSGVVGPAEALDAEAYAKVGKQYVWQRAALSPEILRVFRQLREPNDAMHNLGRQEQEDGDWEGYSWSLHNYGWSLTLYKYVDPELEENHG